MKYSVFSLAEKIGWDKNYMGKKLKNMCASKTKKKMNWCFYGIVWASGAINPCNAVNLIYPLKERFNIKRKNVWNEKQPLIVWCSEAINPFNAVKGRLIKKEKSFEVKNKHLNDVIILLFPRSTFSICTNALKI